MTSMSDATPPGLDAILRELGGDETPNLDTFRAAALTHPELRDDIMGLAIEWLSTEFGEPASAPPGDNLIDDSADRFWAAVPASSVDPFAGLTPPELRSVATQCDIDLSILMKLCDRLIEELTIPACLIVDLARHLKRAPGEMLGFLSLAPTLAKADYKAPSPPAAGQKISFAAAVHLSAMSDAQRNKWLALSRRPDG